MTRDLSFAAALAFARDLVRIPSLSGHEGELARRIEAELRVLGFDEVWLDEVGNVVGVARGGGAGGGPAVMLSSHLDMVDVGDADSWEHPPFAAELAGGFLHGRGAMDIKGPLALQTYAAARFLDERLPGDVIVGHTVYEERGGWGMAHLLASGRVRPDAVILGEATRGDVCIGHRGRAELVVEVRGVAGHASAPERARNPLEALPALLPALAAFGARLPADAVLGRSTVAPTEIETLPRSRNVIPDRARIALDWRTLPGLTPEAARAELAAFLRREVPLPDGCALEVHTPDERQRAWTGLEQLQPMFSPGYLLSPEHPIVGAAMRAVRAGTGREPAVRPWTFATDGGHTCGRHGIPTIGFAPGDEAYAHTNRERLELAQAEQVYRAYPEVVRAVMAAA